MDDRDAQNIYSRLEELEKHDKENLHLVSKHVTLMKSKFSSMDRVLQNINKNQIDLEERLKIFSKKLQGEMASVKAELKQVHIQTEFNEITLFILNKLQQVYFHLAEEYSAINALHQNKIHPLILSGTDLLHIYQEITKLSNEHQSLNDFNLLSQIIEVDSLQTGNKFLVRITIPLTETLSYTVNKIYLLPFQPLGTKFSVFHISSNYLLNNTKYHQYLEMTNQDFHTSCIAISANYSIGYLCQQNQPKSIGPEQKSCVINMFNNRLKSQTLCPYRIKKSIDDLLVKMNQKNNWLFAFQFQQPKDLAIYCKGINSRKTLVGQGVLILKHKCSYHLENLELPYENSFEKSLPVYEPEPLNLPHFTFNKAFIQNLSTPKLEIPQIKHNMDSLDALKIESKSIEDLEKEITLTELQRKSESHRIQSHLNSGVLGTALITLTIILIILKCKKLRDTKREHLGQEVQATNETTSAEINPPDCSVRNSAEKTDIERESKPSSRIPTPPPFPQLSLATPSGRKTRTLSSFRVKF